MFCPNCGNKMNDNAVFCSNCGFKNKKNKKNISMSNIKIPNIKKFIPIIVGIVVVITLVFIVKGIISNRNCKYDGCDRQIYKEGYCREHYAYEISKKNTEDVINGNKSIGDAINDVYENVYGDDNKNKKKDESVCKARGCYQSVYQDGLCKDHYITKSFGIDFDLD